VRCFFGLAPKLASPPREVSAANRAHLKFKPVQLRIEKAVYGGDGLGRLPADERGRGKSVFVPFVLEGERVESTITEQKAGFARAQLDRVLEASAERVSPACRYFQRCGGCHYQHSNYAHQLKMKAAILRETLQRTGKIELPCELQIHPSPPWNYRNRTRLKVQTAPEFALGYYRFRSHDFLPIEECPIGSPLINRAIAEICGFARKAQIPIELREIELFANQSDDSLLVEAYCAFGMRRTEASLLAEKLVTVMPEIIGATVFEQTRAAEAKYLAHCGEPQLEYRTKASYRVSAGSFFQVNRFLIDELVDIVTADHSGELALDLYAGVGLFSRILARNFAQVIAVEASQSSYADLRENTPREVKAIRATTERYLEAAPVRAGFVVADPPRGGLGESVVRGLARISAPRVTYVSCDPSTLGRDLGTFVELGYRIEGAHFIDLFPQTYHLESVFLLAR
jgi:23S rRNA (uracil1939-C5)-methyltransferase